MPSLKQAQAEEYEVDCIRYYMFRDKWLTSPNAEIRDAGRMKMAEIRVRYPGVTDWDI